MHYTKAGMQEIAKSSHFFLVWESALSVGQLSFSVPCFHVQVVL